MTTTTPTSGPSTSPTVVAVNPLSTDIDWDVVERTLGIRIVQSWLQREVVHPARLSERVDDLLGAKTDPVDRVGEFSDLIGLRGFPEGHRLLGADGDVGSSLNEGLATTEHHTSPSSVAGCSEGTGSAGSASDDPAEHRDRFAERIELLINRDAWDLAIEIVTLLAPGVRDAEKELAAKRLVDLVWLMAGAR